eukprot:gene8386-6053_t
MSFSNVATLEGIEPVNQLSPNARTCNCCNVVISSGMDPLKLFAFNNNRVKLFKLPINGEMVPNRLLSLSANTDNLLHE